MKKSKIYIFIQVLILMLVLGGCNLQEDPKVDPKPVVDPIVGEVTDDLMKTPYTDKLTLKASYEGKEFIADGIGLVTVETYVDGDTTIFKSENGTTFTVRYNGVDTPESTYKVEPWGFSASRFTSKKLRNAEKIVLQADEVKTSRLDSTGKRYLAWVWYLPKDATEFRLLNMELVEQSYTTAKASGTMYTDEMYNADLNAQKLKVRVNNKAMKDPDYDYSEYGEYFTIKQLRNIYTQEDINNEVDKGKKIRVKGIVARTYGTGSCYLLQKEEGTWYVGSRDTEISASGSVPFIGQNLNWWIDNTDLEVKAENGIVGQTIYQYYLAGLANPTDAIAENEWYESNSYEKVNEEIKMPYIVCDPHWYGMYLYGGYNDVTKLVVGREISVEGNIGYYNGSIQITGVSNSTVMTINSILVEPYILSIDSSEFTLDNTIIMGCLVKIEDLEVIDGYDTATNDGYTIKTVTKDGIRINIRVDQNISIKLNDQGSIDPEGTVKNKTWKTFEGMTFESIIGIVGVYAYEDNDPEIQLLLTSTTDINILK